MSCEHVAIPDTEVPPTVVPVFQHGITTDACVVNKTAGVHHELTKNR